MTRPTNRFVQDMTAALEEVLEEVLEEDDLGLRYDILESFPNLH